MIIKTKECSALHKYSPSLTFFIVLELGTDMTYVINLHKITHNSEVQKKSVIGYIFIITAVNLGAWWG